MENFKRKNERMAQIAYPYFEYVYKNNEAMSNKSIYWIIFQKFYLLVLFQYKIAEKLVFLKEKFVLIVKVMRFLNMEFHQVNNVIDVNLVFEHLQIFQNQSYQGLNCL